METRSLNAPARETVNPEVGSFVVPDGWSCGAFLHECDWEGAPFRIMAPRTQVNVAVRIEVTSRKVRWGKGTPTPNEIHTDWVRVRITWVGDGEPDRHSGGWMEV